MIVEVFLQTQKDTGLKKGCNGAFGYLHRGDLMHPFSKEQLKTEHNHRFQVRHGNAALFKAFRHQVENALAAIGYQGEAHIQKGQAVGQQRSSFAGKGFVARRAKHHVGEVNESNE